MRETAKEHTSLLPHRDAVADEIERGGSATFSATVINLMKTCMGTGTLALPFACQQGGLVLHSIGLLGIAGWNLYSVHRLCQALEYLKADSNHPTIPPHGISTFGKVAWFAFGQHGVHGLDVLLVILFFGIIVAYEGKFAHFSIISKTRRGLTNSVDAVLGFLEDTPVTTGSKLLNALVISLIVGTLSLVPDMGYLAKASASGLVVLGFTFATIAFYATPSVVHQQINLWPQDGMAGASNWFGCVVFGFGVVPLTYNYYESMARPQHLTRAAAVALLGVAICYMIVGWGLLSLYYPVQGDILQQLPINGIAPLFVRLAMVVVVVLTSPLIVLPCSLIIEEKLLSAATKPMQATIRYVICVLCATISVGIPGFVYVLSFVGCCSVALVGFIIPPLLHIALVLKHEPSVPIAGLVLDFIMLTWGLSATIISSANTFRRLRGN